MALDDDSCYVALAARDRRFDGVFYVGVSTTGVYCRPICPARTPGRARCQFFVHPAAAEGAGFRACLRCRPELAPGNSSVDSVSRLVRAASARIEEGGLNEASVPSLAASLGVTARHLRRAMQAELGITPAELARARRLGIAKQLVQDTAMPISSVAFASGFASVRRLNAVFRESFGRAPSAIRRRGAARPLDAVALRLGYRPPLDFAAMLRFLSGRAIPGIEDIAEHSYRRYVVSEQGGKRVADWICVTADDASSNLVVQIPAALTAKLAQISARIRRVFDLDARPTEISAHLAKSDILRKLVAINPGMRVPGAFDPFELSIRAVLGQQVSVRGASTLTQRLVERFGHAIDGTAAKIFPSASRLAEVPVLEMRTIGLPESRARTVLELSAAVAVGRVLLEDTSDPEKAIFALQSVHGIGPWTAHYIAMRALQWPDAFPASDLGLRKALGTARDRQTTELACAWRPWRAYAAMHLWGSLSPGESQ